jgi:hypothetical protein
MRRNFVYEGLAETYYSRDQYVRHLHQGNENQNERGSNESKYYRGLIPSESWNYFEDVMSNEWDAVERCGTPTISWRERHKLLEPMVPRVCTGQHTIPSLLNKTLFKIAAMLNSSKEVDPRLRDTIPGTLMDRIIPQLSFQALKRLFGDEWTSFLGPSKYRTLLACIKNEEDVYRYLYYYNSAHPLLETDLLLNVFEMRFVLTYEPLPENELLICRAHKKGFFRNFEFSDFPNWDRKYPDFELSPGDQVIADQETFKARFEDYTLGAFKDFDWSNVFVAGGSVLHCLRQMKGAESKEDLEQVFKSFYDWSDIDMYIYGLNEKDTKNKVVDIYNCVKKVFPKLFVVESKNTFTLFATGMRPIQVITAMYKSIAEILLSFDLGCIMVGYNGADVLCMPRFLVSMKYLTNHLDSDMNLSNKLQWFRLQKYAVRYFNSTLPAAFRFHGLNGFDQDLPHVEQIREKDVELSFKKIVEIMSLSKMSLLEQTLPKFWMNFPFKWSVRWHQGVSFNYRRSAFDETHALEKWGLEKELTEEFSNLDLNFLTSVQEYGFWDEPPGYPDAPTWSMDDLKRDAAQHFKNLTEKNKASNVTGLKNILKSVKLNPFTESLLQCYYLDAIVECDTCSRTTKIGDDENPFMRMNSAMSTITYSSESCEFEWNNLSPSTVGTIQSEALQLGGSYWQLSLEIPKKGDLLWLSLNKLEDAVETERRRLMQYYFVNFVISFKNTDPDHEEFNLHFDGSYIFKSAEGSNQWKTFIYRPYLFKPKEFDTDPLEMPFVIGNMVQSQVEFVNEGAIRGKLTMQFHTPNLEVVNI